MKKMLLLLLLIPQASQAGWFDHTSDPVPDYRTKIITLENQVSAQHHTLDLWQIATGSLGIACAFLFILGTALGTTTRKHYVRTRRMGHLSSVNGRQSQFMGEATGDDLEAPLAA
ncbi:hypothetical protein [Prosthecobacter dejongeii]|uniref:Uncharacterized protein n=1 Tax=Prosthecobacter dejongeii TaxID=48465 RepID=A0A7W7YK21_9BACT|nr:hypothetical protein [Prosthecobacter dejongeii]MBB5037544.1 hypothetical protein [Prosthecobacter dejongeii]